MDFQKAKEIFENLYQSINGYSISLEARKKQNLFDKSLTYGEINFDSFYEMLKVVAPKKEDVFYDLGSGTGKAVIAGHLLFDFKKSIGIEILPALYLTSKKIKEFYNKKIRKTIKKIWNEELTGEIDFLLGDFLNIPFFDGDIIFANSTCFDEELRNKLENLFLKLKKGTRILMLTHFLKNNLHFKLIASKIFLQGWGEATVNFYQKVI